MVLRYDKNLITKHNKIDKSSINSSEDSCIKNIGRSGEILFPSFLKQQTVSDIGRLKRIIEYATFIAYPGNYSSAYVGGYVLFKFLKDLFKYQETSKSFDNLKVVDIEYSPMFSSIIYKNTNNSDLKFSHTDDEYNSRFMVFNETKEIEQVINIIYDLLVYSEVTASTYHVFDTFLITFDFNNEKKYCVLTFLKNINSTYKQMPWMFQVRKSRFEEIKNINENIFKSQSYPDITMNDYSVDLF